MGDTHKTITKQGKRKKTGGSAALSETAACRMMKKGENLADEAVITKLNIKNDTGNMSAK